MIPMAAKMSRKMAFLPSEPILLLILDPTFNGCIVVVCISGVVDSFAARVVVGMDRFIVRVDFLWGNFVGL